jgi:hypothetical protein
MGIHAAGCAEAMAASVGDSDLAAALVRCPLHAMPKHCSEPACHRRQLPCQQAPQAPQHASCNAPPSSSTATELIGRELHIKASFLNHSCAPNCMVRRGVGRAAIVTLRAIEVGAVLLHATPAWHRDERIADDYNTACRRARS